MTKKEMRNKIDYEIVVDCYDEGEVMSGWFCFFEDELSFPFKAETELGYKSGKRKISEVNVLRMNLQSGSFDEAIIVFEVNPKDMDIVFEVPISKLKPLIGDEHIIEAFKLWDFWNSNKY